MGKDEKRDYLGLVQQMPADRIALVLHDRQYTFGMLVEQAKKRRMQERLQSGEGKYIRIIQTPEIDEQLINFLAYSGTEAVPVIVPLDVQIDTEILSEDVPKASCMAVMSSGTTGKNKFMFRSFRSWQTYFDIQNKIFKMGDGSRIFMQGSLAFTGNLNLYMAQLTTGGTVIAERIFKPKLWMKQIEQWQADVIYLIPTKLNVLHKVYHRKKSINDSVKSIISGSQSLGGSEVEKLKQVFQKATVTLYYGASELNYITYIKDSQMGDDKRLIGKPFPKVKVCVKNGEIRVNTDYGVIGTKEEAWVGDCGHFDQNGMLYLDGRKDGLCNINGRKVFSSEIENKLEAFPGITEAAVKVVKREGHDTLVAWIVPEEGERIDLIQVKEYLRTSLSGWEVPKTILCVTTLPKTESGKVLKRKLMV